MTNNGLAQLIAREITSRFYLCTDKGIGGEGTFTEPLLLSYHRGAQRTASRYDHAAPVVSSGKLFWPVSTPEKDFHIFACTHTALPYHGIVSNEADITQ